MNEQSGIQAGSGGFDINVKGNTDLKGAVIASTATPDKNQLTTGTLTFSDIQNHSDYNASSSGFSLSGSLGNGGENYKRAEDRRTSNVGGGAPMLSQNDSSSESATTRSAISQGTITITDKANQKQDVASLSRDTTGANGTVSKTPDLQNILNNQADMMSAAQAAGQAVAQRIGDYADGKKKEAEAAAKQATKDGNTELAAQYQAEADSWKEGGVNRAGMQAAGAAVVAGLGGGSAIGGAAGAGLSSLAAGKLNDLSSAISGSNPTGNKNVDEALGNIVSNALATAVGGAVGGNAGAISASNVDRFNRQLHEDSKAKEQTLARKLAEQSGGLYTEQQVADALRLANNKALGENAGSNVVVDIGKNPGGYYDGAHMKTSDGQTFVQDTNAIAKPSDGLIGYIVANTGGASSPYSWSSTPSGSATASTHVNPFTPAPNGCITAECAGGLANNGPSPMRPDYATGGLSVLSGTASGAVNLHDGTTYLGAGVTQNFPIATWNPGATGTLGWIMGGRDAAATNNFLNGDGNQAFVSVPTPFKFNFVGAVTHAYGGATAVEVGISTPGDFNFGITPWNHSVPRSATGN
ncbi:polymorphic toxin type 22 domain-containing protein [Ralstonia mannitolilytica]|uniref:polymorphic toxin type 22 domain-containing protein n=4 Tax=Ralstonia mannitolilytica TaxID=105219 RepID=UPI003B8424A8